MTQQLTLDGLGSGANGGPRQGRVIATDLQGEMQRSYLEYAMSVIVGRALPDVRDGLKPVHRRILYAMHELGLTPERPYRKCARVVGDVLGKYHPHGDQAVYDALVRMVQEFSSRYPLVAGHGNFGSVDDDPPAAMRYTECRLAQVSNTALLDQVGEEIVEFMPNFDGSQAEPTVLPARLPILLLNGSSGIAVGMATNIPPHNLGELVDGLLALIDNPDLEPEALLQWIPGPDFPTGGQIVDSQGIREAYLTGRGSIPMRGVAQFEEIQPGKGRHRRPAIIITEFPYQVNKAAWLEKVAELVNQDRITGIADLRDESDRTGIRVVVELKREANPQAVLQQLYKLTPLQSNFGAILLALVNGEPQQLTLKGILQHFLDFREATLNRIFRADLQRVQRKAEEVEGMLLALADLDGVIDLLRRAPDGATAKGQLQTHLGCTPQQADTILAMPLRRLTGLERERLQQEHAELQARIEELQGLLEDRRKRLNYLKKELRQLKKTHADPRRTQILSASELEAEVAQIPTGEDSEDTQFLLQFTRKGYVRRLPIPGRRSRSNPAHRELGEDGLIDLESVALNQEILVLTASGRAFTVPVEGIPLSTGQSRGVPLQTLLPTPEPIIATFTLDPNQVEAALVLLSKQGRIKRVALADFVGLTQRGSTALKLKEDDELGWAAIHDPRQGDCTVILATSGGRLLRLPLNSEQIPLMSRVAMGNQALRLGRNEQIVGMVLLPPEGILTLASRLGYLKRLSLSEIPTMERGRVGVQAFKFSSKNDALAGVVGLTPELERQPQLQLDLLTESERVHSFLPADIPLQNRGGGGSLLVKGERVKDLCLFRPRWLPEGVAG
ncbi:MAG: DNA topoisomerase (ATP-hydrolyzing) [Thermostichus sp. DRC_bins_24]